MLQFFFLTYITILIYSIMMSTYSKRQSILFVDLSRISEYVHTWVTYFQIIFRIFVLSHTVHLPINQIRVLLLSTEYMDTAFEINNFWIFNRS